MKYNESALEEQLMLIKSLHLPNRTYVKWMIGDSSSTSLPERWFLPGREEYKGLFESRESYIYRIIMNGSLLRYSNHICAVQGKIALNFKIKEEGEIKKHDIFVGELGFYKAELIYQGTYNSQDLPSTFSPRKPHEISFSKNKLFNCGRLSQES